LKVQVGPSAIHGTGVLATQPIAKGEAVLRIDDSRVVDDAHPLRPERGEYEHHCDWLAGKTVLMQTPERHINHCCDPNTFVKTVNGGRYVFALRDIAAEEEVTYDYCINGWGDVVWECACGSPRCRHTIHSDFFHLPDALQVEYLPLLDDWYIAAYSAQAEALLRRVLGAS
jgi:hypothetical protein